MAPDAVDVLLRVDAAELLLGGRGRLADIPAEPPALVEELLEPADPVGALGVLPGVVLEGRGVAQIERIGDGVTVPSLS